MKTITGLIFIVLFVCSTLAYAGGDQNKHRHDGAKGKGNVNQERVNK